MESANLNTTTIDLTKESQLQLDAADITVEGETIQFCVQGEIQYIPNDMLKQYHDGSLLPSEIRLSRGDAHKIEYRNH